MTLFTLDRVNLAKRLRGLPTTSPFAVLCTEPDGIWIAARTQVDDWFANFPAGPKKIELERNITNFGDQHIGAFFELACFYLLKEVNQPVELNDESVAAFPDFFLTTTADLSLYVEVTTIQSSAFDEKQENMVRDFINRIEKSINTKCHLILHIHRLTEVKGQDFLASEAKAIAEIIDNNAFDKDGIESIYTVGANDGTFYADIIWGGLSSGETSVGVMGPAKSQSTEELQKNIGDRPKRKIKRHLEVSPESPLLVVLGSDSTEPGIHHDNSYHVGYGHEIIQVQLDEKSLPQKANVAIHTHTGLFTPSIRGGLIIPPSNRCCVGILDIKRVGLDDKGFRFQSSYTPNIFARDPERILSPKLPKTISEYSFSFDTGKFGITQPEEQEYYGTNLLI